MKGEEIMELKKLVGKHFLDAVDFNTKRVKEDYGDGYGDCQTISFRLHGKVYTAVEDPEDGYRSCMKHIKVSTTYKMKNIFSPIEVLGRHKIGGEYGQTSDILELISTINGETILEVGTKNADDYYPSFVANFNTENLL